MRRKSAFRRFLYWSGGVAFALLETRFERKSEVGAERSGARLGRICYYLFGKNRKRALWNLTLAFPEKSDVERRQIAIGVFEHFGRVAGDFLRSMARTDAEVKASIEVEGLENGEAALAMGRGVIAVTAHFGNWERLAHWFAANGGEITVVARDANDQGMQKQVQRIRKKAGIRVLSRGRSTRAIVELLRNKEIVGLLPDQNSEEAFLPFFGKPCGTVLGPAKLHQMTGAPLLPVYCPRVGPAKYRLVIGKIIDPGKAQSPQEIMTQLNASLEAVVREYPEQWLWIHDRWKSARQRGYV